MTRCYICNMAFYKCNITMALKISDLLQCFTWNVYRCKTDGGSSKRAAGGQRRRAFGAAGIVRAAGHGGGPLRRRAVRAGGHGGRAEDCAWG